jgi:DNA-binding NarL/FixJ family response regulator
MIRVLIVEDHEVVRDALAALLRESPGMEVVGVASSVRDALPLLGRRNPDVVLADLSLGDGSGIELVSAIRRAGLQGRVLVITGFGDAFAATEALGCGAAGYALKSQSSAEVLEAIRIVALGRQYVAPQVAAKLSLRPTGNGAIRVELSGGLESLSRREHEVFHQLVEGYTLKEIARRLCISKKTVETHRWRINQKLALRTASDVIRYAVAHGIPVAPRTIGEPPLTRETAGPVRPH